MMDKVYILWKTYKEIGIQKYSVKTQRKKTEANKYEHSRKNQQHEPKKSKSRRKIRFSIRIRNRQPTSRTRKILPRKHHNMRTKHMVQRRPQT